MICSRFKDTYEMRHIGQTRRVQIFNSRGRIVTWISGKHLLELLHNIKY